MLAQIFKLRRAQARFVILLFCAGALISCAEKKQQPLIADPSVVGHESALPWNERKRWEQQGQFAGGFTEEGQGRH